MRGSRSLCVCRRVAGQITGYEPKWDFAHEFAEDEEKFDSSTMDTSGLERAVKGGEFEEKSKTVPRDQGGNNELLDLMRGLAGRLERLGSSQTELRKEVAHGVKAGREMGDHPRTPDRSPSMFESALGRGPRMHLDSLSETPEREANRRRYFNGDHDGYLRSISVDMVTQITYDNPTVILELIEFHAWVGWK